jgi:hypothetical protein
LTPLSPQTNHNDTLAAPITPLTGPLTFNVSLFARPYKITVHTSTSALFVDEFPISPPPSVAILVFSVADRVSLFNTGNYWLRQLRQRYPDEADMKIMLLGLKRDSRTAKKVPRRNWEDAMAGANGAGGAEDGVRVFGERVVGVGARETANLRGGQERDWEFECVMPQEGLQAARDMGADLYAECSALTGELMWEAVEDMTKMAAKAAVEAQKEANSSCVVM